MAAFGDAFGGRRVSQQRRAPRVQYGAVALSDAGEIRRAWSRPRCAVVGVCVCLLLGVAAVAVLLTGSDLTLPATPAASSSGTSLIRAERECHVDADCLDCCGAADVLLSLNPCLLPPNTTAAPTCVDHCCVPAPPQHAPDGTPCDDHRFCSLSDRCLQGQCVGTTRECQDADFCTVEECSETLRTCVSGARQDALHCQNDCASDEDCRSNFYCLPSHRCGRFPEANGTLWLSGYDFERCVDLAGDAYRMVQHYTLFERTYDGAQGLRFRDAVDVVLPQTVDPHQLEFSPASEGIPLAEVGFVSETRVVQYGEQTFGETSVTLRTACQETHRDDPNRCLSVWADRTYSFEVAYHDCAVDVSGACLSNLWWQGYSMALGVAYCPSFAHVQYVDVLDWLHVAAADSPETPQHEFNMLDIVRVVWETDFGDVFDPFLTDVTVCTVDVAHRLSACALNANTTTPCPFRGCEGWSDADSPLLSRRRYLVDGERTADASLHQVRFCRDAAKYNHGVCAAGPCGWSRRPSNATTSWGGADGFEFQLYESVGSVAVIDVRVRFADCDAVSDTGNVQRHVGYIHLQA